MIEYILVIISVYDLLMEIPIFIKSPRRYFERLIKVVNLVAVILIFINVADPDVKMTHFWTI